MLYTNFSQNWNNSMLGDTFSDIRMDETFELYQQREIRLSNQTIGIAKVVALRSFNFSHLTDELAYAVCGHDARYLTTILNKMHGKLNGYDKLTWVTFQWVKMDMALLENIWQNAWQKTVEKHLPAYHDNLQGKQLEFAIANA